MVTYDELLAAARRAPRGRRIPYGDGALAFGELTLPAGPRAGAPVVVFIHGGCWQANYSLDHVTATTAAIAELGWAVWAPEYRRLGDAGGGWPGTFDDVARAIAHVDTLARDHLLDLERLVLAGHSAGGHLALWGAAHASSAGRRVAGVLCLAGISDLAAYGAEPGGCNASVTPLLGGRPHDVPERYRDASPIERLPLGVPVVMVHGAADPIVPVAMSEAYAERARAAGDRVDLVVVPEAGHFDVVAPGAPAWRETAGALSRLVQGM